MRNNKQKGFTLRRFIAICMAMLVMLGANGTALTAEGQQTPGTGDETVTETVTQPSPETTEELNDEPTGDPTGDQKKEDQPEGQTEGQPEDSEESKEPTDNPGTDLNPEGNAAPADNNQEGTPEAKGGESEDKTAEYTVTDSLPEAAPAELAESKLTVAPKAAVKEESVAKEPAAEAEKEPAEEEENEEEKSEEQPMTLMSQPVGASLLSEPSASVTQPDVSGSKKASPTELTPEQRETTVTLSLPSGEYKNKYDIVFVMDSSSSTVNNKIDFGKVAIELFDSLTEKNADLKIGVIKCRGLAFDTVSLSSGGSYTELVKYDDASKQAITDGLNFKETDLKALSSGTNMHGGLDMANEWLEADTEVADNHKFVIFLLDGKTYIWNDENNVPTTVYGQYMAKNKVYSTPAVGQQTIAYSKSAYKFIDGINFRSATAEELARLSFDEYFAKTGNFYANDYAKLYASTNTELSNKTKYDYRCAYAYKEGSTAEGTVTVHELTNGDRGTSKYQLHTKYYEFVPSGQYTDLKWLQANPYTVEENERVYSYTDTVNPDFYQLHPDSLQKALYLTGHLWTDMVKKYNGAVIIFDGWDGGSGLEIARSFNSWIQGDEISDYAADINNADSVAAMFDSIKEDIMYMVAEGVVTDIITDDFTLVDSGNDTFKLTVGGETIPGTKDGNTWTFGENYKVTYYPDENKFEWAINVPIENANPLTLSYKLRLNEGAEDGNSYDTNVSAVLDYTTSDGKDGSFTFEIPVVTYSEPKPTPTPTPTPTSKPTPTPEPESNPKSTPTPTPDYVVTCQMAGYPADYVWNESVKACVPGFRRTKVPNTYDKGLMGNFTTFLISDLLGIAAVLLLKKY